MREDACRDSNQANAHAEGAVIEASAWAVEAILQAAHIISESGVQYM